MPKIQVQIGDHVQDIDGSELNVVVPDPKHTEEIHYPKFITLDYDASRYHGERVSQDGLHPETTKLFTKVFLGQDQVWLMDGVVNVQLVQRQGKDMHRHILGLMDMTLKLQDMGLSVAWKYPETGLHPEHQLGLGDVAIYLSQRFSHGQERAEEK